MGLWEQNKSSIVRQCNEQGEREEEDYLQGKKKFSELTWSFQVDRSRAVIERDPIIFESFHQRECERRRRRLFGRMERRRNEKGEGKDAWEDGTKESNNTPPPSSTAVSSSSSSPPPSYSPLLYLYLPEDEYPEDYPRKWIDARE